MFNNSYFQQAIEFINSHDLFALPLGKTFIDGENLYVNVVNVELKSASKAKFEAHKRYIDIQIPLSASESYGVKNLSECEYPIGEFNDDDDYILFEDKIENVEIRQPGEMIVFTPDDAHAPLIGEGLIRKAIFKVRIK